MTQPAVLAAGECHQHDQAEYVGTLAAACLHLEVRTHPKPGMVSHLDCGSHTYMDAALLHRSANVLRPYFSELWAAGRAGAGMAHLRRVGMAAERAMLAATSQVNTHRGAIFGLGLLAAAAGFRASFRRKAPLGRILARLWGRGILSGPVALHSHGTRAMLQYGVGGARHEAAAGFPSLYRIAIPALLEGQSLSPYDPESARIHACMALIASVSDTNLLHRGGREGLQFARRAASRFLAAGGVGHPGWRAEAQRMHLEFVERRLSPGGCADLLAMALFVRSIESEDDSP